MKPQLARRREIGFRRRTAFTLVELLVSIGIIAVLISILMPALSRARDAATTIKCAANLRSIGQGLMVYATQNNGYLPVAYNYRGSKIDPGTGAQTPTDANWGYIHWGYYILGNASADPFSCPAMTRGGFPATHPVPGEFDPGQLPDPANTGAGLPGELAGTVSAVTVNGYTYYPDAQPARMAYALNEAVCGRNKYVVGFQGCTRTYRPVSLTEVDDGSTTILATEYIDEWGIVSNVDRSGGPVPCISHRPIQPFRADGAGLGDALCDVANLSAGTLLRKSAAADLWLVSGGARSLDLIRDYQRGIYTPIDRATRLDFVGRNHGSNAFRADNMTNFLYMDGHVELKHIAKTIPAAINGESPWEWGRLPYSVSPNTMR